MSENLWTDFTVVELSRRTQFEEPDLQLAANHLLWSGQSDDKTAQTLRSLILSGWQGTATDFADVMIRIFAVTAEAHRTLNVIERLCDGKTDQGDDHS